MRDGAVEFYAMEWGWGGGGTFLSCVAAGRIESVHKVLVEVKL